MAALITLAQAKLQLRIDTPAGDPGDADILLKRDQASGIILDYLKSRAIAGWTDGPDDATPPSIAVPGPVQAATLLMLSNLFEHRDELKPDADTWLAVERLLVRFRDPALA